MIKKSMHSMSVVPLFIHYLYKTPGMYLREENCIVDDLLFVNPEKIR